MTIGSGKSVIIIGAGLAGTLMATYLARMGFRVGVYERRGDPRAAGFKGGRSINLALSARGLWGLEGVGLDGVILERAIPMKGRMIHPVDARRGLTFQPYSSNPQDSIKSVSRSGLNLALIEAAARHENVSLCFGRRCVEVDLERCTAVFEGDAGGPGDGTPTSEVVTSDLIIGTDGAFSAVRARMQLSERFDYSQSFLSHGYKELHVPALPEHHADFSRWAGFALDPSALHIWPRGRAMMIALPNPDRSFTCTLFWPYEGDHGFEGVRTEADVRSFFSRFYPDAVPLMPTLVEDYLSNPTGSLVTVRCWPWVHRCAGEGAVMVLGDAAHAIVPFFGQGMNAAFEDVRVFRDCLAKHGASAGSKEKEWVADAADEFQRLRKPNTDAIARMALDNFVEMRDKVGTRVFVARKRVEHALHELFPDAMAPRYNLVSFSTVPYAEALRRGARPGRVIRGLVLVVALSASLILLMFGVPGWFLVGVTLIGAWIAWDRWAVARESGA